MSETTSLKPYVRKSFILHAAMILLLFILTPSAPEKVKKSKVHVSTIKLAEASAETTKQPPLSKKELEQPKLETKKETPKAEVKKETPKVETKKETKKTEIKKETPKPEVKKEIAKTDPKKDALLKEARASLAKMGKGEATSPEAGRSSLKPLTSLKAEEGLFSVKGENDQYTGELVKRLKLSLRLPESGQVLVDLKLQRSGRVAQVKILEAKSSINQKYVEATLPNLNFPDFGEFYPKEDEKLFTLSLQNELF
jgi:outer membrane biosynthesis protein TonB